MSANHARHIDILHYRQDGIVVTNRFFSTDARRYKVDELTDLGQALGPQHPGVALGLAVAGVDLVAAVPLVMLNLALIALMIGVPILIAAFVVSVYSSKHWPARRELLARHRGRRVTLFATTSERDFGQVSRALIRAIESAHGGGKDAR
jgi:hypothetical protein